MRKDAEAHAEEDKRQREEIEVRNEADSSVYRSEKLLKDGADKLSADNKSKIEQALNTLKEALKGADSAAMKTASDKLNEVWQTASAELYKDASSKGKAQQAEAESGSKTNTNTKDEGPIIDAEVVDDNKK